MNEKLFEQVKQKLNITWNDEGTDKEVKKIINNAIPAMVDILGIADKDFDFSVDGDENSLFRNYCLYDWNHVLNEFEDNYRRMIARVRRKHEVAQFKESGVGNEA